MRAIQCDSRPGHYGTEIEVDPADIEDPKVFYRVNVNGERSQWVSYYIEGYLYESRFEWLPGNLQRRLTPFAPLLPTD